MSQRKCDKVPGFGSYLLALILPFVYFFSRGRAGAGIMALILCFIALPLMFFGVGFILWLIVCLWAIYGLREETASARLALLGQSIAQASAQHKPA
jgi:hypothetical protein